MCLIPQTFRRASWNADPFLVPSKQGGKKIGSRRTKLYKPQPSRDCYDVFLNLSTCVLCVCCHKYYREVQLPLAPQFLIPTITSVFMTLHWKDGALPVDDLMALNSEPLVQSSRWWQNCLFAIWSSNYGLTYHSISHVWGTMGGFIPKRDIETRCTSIWMWSSSHDSWTYFSLFKLLFWSCCTLIVH